MKRISSLRHFSIRIAARLASGAACWAMSVSLTGCAGFQRSHESGYAYDPVVSEPSSRRDRKRLEFTDSAHELGLSGHSDLHDDQLSAIRLRMTLKKAEKSIQGRKEREQYYMNKPYFQNDRQRLEFLKLDSFESREAWLNARGIQGRLTPHPAPIQRLIDENDITLGMTKQAVRDAWGEPETVEVAGNPVYGNERWHYSEQVSSTEGYQTERRLVYFESGRVAGWETR